MQAVSIGWFSNQYSLRLASLQCPEVSRPKQMWNSSHVAGNHFRKCECLPSFLDLKKVRCIPIWISYNNVKEIIKVCLKVLTVKVSPDEPLNSNHGCLTRTFVEVYTTPFTGPDESLIHTFFVFGLSVV